MRVAVPSAKVCCRLSSLLVNGYVYDLCHRRRRRRRGSEVTRSEVVAKKTANQQSRNSAEGQTPSTDDRLVVGGSGSDQGGRAVTEVLSVSSRVAVSSTDRWAVRPHLWLDNNTTAAKPGRYSDVIGPFD